MMQKFDVGRNHMRTASLLFTLLLAAVCGWGQDAPANAAPQGQSAPPQMRHRGGFRRMGVAGTITAISSDSLTVKTMDGATAQVKLTDKTQYRKQRQAAKLEDFKVGDQIFVRGQPAGEDAWQAEVVVARLAGGFGPMDFQAELGKRFIAGEIKAIDGTQLTIARPDGVNQKITVDESTSFRKDGQSVTLADLKPGDHVFGRGEVKNDVFVPAVLNVGQPRMMIMRGRGQEMGPGGQQDQSQPPESH
jgi:Domain of unknown function (DUF5666)